MKRKQNQTKRSSKGGVPPTGPVGDHTARLRLRLPHPGRGIDPSRSAPGESNQGSPPNLHWGPCRRRRCRPHRSSSRGVWLVPRGDGVPDPAFCLDFAFPCGARLLVQLPRRRRTWIWRRSTRSWPRSTDRSAISSEHCSELKQFDLLRFWLLVVCSCCPRMLVRSQLVSLLAAISGAEHKFGDQVIDL